MIGSFTGMWLSFYIIKRFGASSASQTSYVLPVVSVILGCCSWMSRSRGR
jgi:drug/metabolite transporter (DMT)-like permease